MKFITSFNEILYLTTGKDLLTTFLRYVPSDMSITVYVEGEDSSYVDVFSDRIKIVNLFDDPWYHNWFDRNIPNIPLKFGGTFDGKQSLWNERSCKWALKAASLFRGYEECDDDVLVWVDCDCMFTRSISADILYGLVRNHDIVYACGKTRKSRTGIETGFVMYRKNDHVIPVINKFKEFYDNMHTDYNRIDRNDDGYVFKHILQSMTRGGEEAFFRDEHYLISGANCKDVAKGDGASIFNSPLSVYITHMKGYHRMTNADQLGSAEHNANKQARQAKYEKDRRRILSKR